MCSVIAVSRKIISHSTHVHMYLTFHSLRKRVHKNNIERQSFCCFSDVQWLIILLLEFSALSGVAAAYVWLFSTGNCELTCL